MSANGQPPALQRVMRLMAGTALGLLLVLIAGFGTPARDLPDGSTSEPIPPKLLVFGLAEE